MSEARLSAHEERAVAVKAGVDPRTVRKFVAGARQSEAIKRALRDAFVELGHGELVPQPRDGETPQPEAGKAER